MQAYTKFLLCYCKIIRIHFFAVNEFSPNPCVGPLPNTNMSFPLLSIYGEELISAPKRTTF